MNHKLIYCSVYIQAIPFAPFQQHQIRTENVQKLLSPKRSFSSPEQQTHPDKKTLFQNCLRSINDGLIGTVPCTRTSNVRMYYKKISLRIPCKKVEKEIKQETEKVNINHMQIKNYVHIYTMIQEEKLAKKVDRVLIVRLLDIERTRYRTKQHFFKSIRPLA